MLAATAFSAGAQLRWAPTASVNFAGYHFKQKLVDVKHGIGFNTGVTAELMFPGIGFGMDFGLQYSMHGAKINLGQKEVWASDGYGNERVTLHTLQIPLHLRYKFTRLQGAERYVAPFLFAGPLFSFHLADNGVKAFDYPAGTVSLQFGVGAELWERLQVFGTFDMGVSYELRTRKLDNYSARPMVWGAGVAYMF